MKINTQTEYLTAKARESTLIANIDNLTSEELDELNNILFTAIDEYEDAHDEQLQSWLNKAN